MQREWEEQQQKNCVAMCCYLDLFATHELIKYILELVEGIKMKAKERKKYTMNFF